MILAKRKFKIRYIFKIKLNFKKRLIIVYKLNKKVDYNFRNVKLKKIINISKI